MGVHDGVQFAASSTGEAWTDLDAAGPSSPAGSHLAGVACANRTACVLVGSAGTRTPGVTTLFATGLGRLQFTPELGNATFTGVSCPTSTSCAASGYVSDTAGRPSPIVVLWDGTSWHRAQVHLPSGSYGLLTSISCTSALSCLAVGQSSSAGGTPIAFARSGSGWVVAPAPPVGSTQNVTLGGVSCVAGGCRVTGSGIDAGNPVGIDLIWNGTAWSTGSTVGPSGAVACLSITSCVAAGVGSPSVSVLAGSTWTTETLPQPTGDTIGAVNGIACPGSLDCVAVGTTTGHSAWIARRSGGSWTQQQLPALPGDDELRGVTCWSTTCTAVGSMLDDQQGLYLTSSG